MKDFNKIVNTIQEDVEYCIKENPNKKIFIVLNKYLFTNSMDISSICLHLVKKYNCLQWPKICCDKYSANYVLFIGVVE